MQQVDNEHDTLREITLKKSQSVFIHGNELQYDGHRRNSVMSQKEMNQITRSFVLVNIINLNMNPREADHLLNGMDLSEDKNILLTKVVNLMLALEVPTDQTNMISGIDGIHNIFLNQLQRYGYFCDNKQKLQLAKSQAQKQKTIECQICLVDVPQTDSTEIPGCHDQYCKGCLKEYLNQKIIIADVIDIRCPRDSCNTVLTDQFIQPQLDELTYEKYQKYKLLNKKRFKRVKILNSNPLLRRCPSSNCDKYVQGEVGSKKVQCPCGTEICFLCSSIYHGRLSCEKSLDQGFQQAMKKLYLNSKNRFLIHSCTKCKSPIQKNSGCNHMTCTQCQYQFCWLCNRLYKANHYNSWNYIYGCPGKQNTQMEPYKYPSLWIYVAQPLITLILLCLFLLCIYGAYYVLSFFTSFVGISTHFIFDSILFCMGLTGPMLLHLSVQIFTRHSQKKGFLVYLIWFILGILFNKITLYIYGFILTCAVLFAVIIFAYNVQKALRR